MASDSDHPSGEILIEEAPIGIFKAHTNGEFFDVNPAACELVGYTEDELLEMSITDLDARYDDLDEYSEFSKALEGGRVQTETALLHTDGHEIDVILDGSRVGDRLIGYVRDISERKEYERELRELKTRFKSFFEKAPEGLVIHDTDGNIIEANRQLSENLEYSREELTSMNVTDIEVGLTGSDVREFFHRMDVGETRKVEGKHERKDGSTYPVEVWANKIDVDGTPRFIVFSRDVTERTEREETLEALQTTVVDLMRAESDEEVAELVVDSVREILGMPVTSVHLYDETDEILEPVGITDQAREVIGDVPSLEIDDSLAGEAFAAGEERIYDDLHTVPDRKNSETELRSEFILPLGDHGVIMSASEEPSSFDERDVSLAGTVAAQTEAALDRVDRQRALERQNERLDEFASIVSHDLRNPLNVAIGRLELAKEECDSDNLSDVARAHDRMETLISDLLTLAREGPATTDITSVELAPLVESCWKNVDTKDATLVTTIDRAIHADVSRLHQLFENLIRNSVDHNDSAVRITIGSLEDGFYLEDDGGGIPPGQREAVFETGHSTSEQGTGFGLRIVQQIVEAHDWNIRVTEGTAGGARFEISGVDFVD